jgi:hypothetical protein
MSGRLGWERFSPQRAQRKESWRIGNELLGAFVDGDGVSWDLEEEAGFLMLDHHVAEHVAGLEVVVFCLLEIVKRETEVIADTLLGVLALNSGMHC